MSVAIDFTSSNGDLKQPSCLHYQYGENGRFNDYESSIVTIGSILEPYATEGKFGVYGFGGIPRFSGGKVVSHCFNLTGTSETEVVGTQNVLALYKKAVKKTSFEGPTNFAPVIQNVLQTMKENEKHHLKKYNCLLILTDGCINDMAATKDVIVECSNYPLSIIIVGIGSADFTNMEVLDGDTQVLRNQRGEPTQRDIVQFVSLNDFKQANISLLAEEVLREVPDQIVSYMKMKGIRP